MKNQNEQILADNNIKRILLKLSLPATAGMLVMALYNVVDTIFVGRGAGAMAIAGLSIVFPIQMIVMALGQLLGIGGASLVSRSIGEGNIKKANRVLGTVYTSAVILSVILTAAALIFKKQFLLLFGATPEIYPFAKDYYEIILLASILFIIAMSSNNLLRSEGHAKVAMITMMIGAILNIILDPIFIFVFDMGIRGAAWATVISQFVSVIFVLQFLKSGKSIMDLSLKNMTINFPILKEIVAVGMSSFMRNVAGSLVFALFNNTLGHYGGDLAIAAYGIIQRFLKFLTMPMIGIAQGLQPIVGYNYGAGRNNKVQEVCMTATVWATGFATAAFILIQLWGQHFVKIFTDSQELIDISASGLKTMTLLIPLVGFIVITTTIFQALGKALPSLILSMSREILFLIPLVFILPGIWGLKGVWLTMPGADILSFLLTLGFFIHLINHLKENDIKIENKIPKAI